MPLGAVTGCRGKVAAVPWGREVTRQGSGAVCRHLLPSLPSGCLAAAGRWFCGPREARRVQCGPEARRPLPVVVGSICLGPWWGWSSLGWPAWLPDCSLERAWESPGATSAPRSPLLGPGPSLCVAVSRGSGALGRWPRADHLGWSPNSATGQPRDLGPLFKLGSRFLPWGPRGAWPGVCADPTPWGRMCRGHLWHLSRPPAVTTQRAGAYPARGQLCRGRRRPRTWWETWAPPVSGDVGLRWPSPL